VNTVGGGGTHICILPSWTKTISRNQMCADQRPVHAWFKMLSGYVRLAISYVVASHPYSFLEKVVHV